jgi:hypothetical protein
VVQQTRIFKHKRARLVLPCPSLPLSLPITQITQNQHPDIQNPPTIHPQIIPIEFPKNSQRIPKEFQKNSKRIPKKFIRIIIEFTKNSQKIPKSNPQQYIPEEFTKNSHRIPKEYKLSKNI